MLLTRFARIRAGQCICNRIKFSANNTLTITIRQYTAVKNTLRTLKNGQSVNKTQFIQSYLQKRWLSQLLDGDITLLRENELKHLFPEPKVTLNILSSRTPEKMFDVYYKQSSNAPKGVKKKHPQYNQWTCTYALVWPEKIHFDSTAVSKKQAAEEAASKAVAWLLARGSIDKRGHPVYATDKLDEIRSTLHDQFKASVSDESMARIEKLWTDYEDGIKYIFINTHEDSVARQLEPSTAICQDSTIDDDGEDLVDEESNRNDEEITGAESKLAHPVYGRYVHPPSEVAIERRQMELNKKFEHYHRELTPLPIDDYAERIATTVANSRATVLVGAAGCGKSTRAPAAILSRLGVKMAAVVSQPRRVAAIGLAQRVAGELGEEVGETVGYHVRLDASPPRAAAGALLYCTSGVLLKRLQTNPGLLGCTHVFIDEAHERDINTDLTLMLLKRALELNDQLRVVVMSATLDVDVFTSYFDNCSVIEVPGRTHPVTVSYLEDLQKELGLQLPETMKASSEDGRLNLCIPEIVNLITKVDQTQPEGAILVFLPGWAEIKGVHRMLTQKLCNESTHLILPVHSRLSTDDQRRMFSRPLPGVRKIVLSTNIAETSITVPDVVYVIDSGVHRQNSITQSGTATLQTAWVSRAAAAQRAGRAGRVAPGHCYRLYTREKEAEFDKYNTPEILRTPLEPTVLACKAFAPRCAAAATLRSLPQPPPRAAVAAAVGDLVELGALTASEVLTPLGHYLTKLTMQPRLACALLHAACVGNIVPVANALTHLQDNIEVFSNAMDRRDEIREAKRQFSPTSDFTALHRIQDEFERTQERGQAGVESFCNMYGLRRDRLGFVKALSSHHLHNLLQSGFIPPYSDSPDFKALNQFGDVHALTDAILLSAFNLMFVTKRVLKTKGKLKVNNEVFISTTNAKAHISSTSVNHALSKTRARSLGVCCSVTQHAARRALLLRHAAQAAPAAAAVWARGEVDVREGVKDGESVLSLGQHNIEIEVPSNQVDTLLKTRQMIWDLFRYHYERDTRNPDRDVDILVSRFKRKLVKALGIMLEEANEGFRNDT